MFLIKYLSNIKHAEVVWVQNRNNGLNDTYTFVNIYVCVRMCVCIHLDTYLSVCVCV